MKQIPLTRGKVAIVDDEDYEWLSQYKWHLNGQGYAVRNVRWSPTHILERMHRAIIRPPSDMEIDHINGNKLDNRRSNLRVVTHSQNQRYQGLQKNSTSGYIGVSFEKRRSNWRAYIVHGGKQKYLGSYKNPVDAARAYDREASRKYGEFAKLNFPEVVL